MVPNYAIRVGMQGFRIDNITKTFVDYWETVKNFTNNNIELMEGDTIYVITDGFPDQFGGPKNKKYKYKVLKQLFISFSDQNIPIKDQLAHLDKEMIDWKEDYEQTDDICVIGVKIT